MKLNEQEFKTFKEEYEKALKGNKETFVFKSRLVLVSYAKYLIQYLEKQFKQH